VTEQLSCDALEAEPPAVVAFENTERSAVEVTLVSARERREPRTELVSSGSKENLAEPAKKKNTRVSGQIHNFLKI